MDGQIILLLVIAAAADIVGATLFLLRKRWEDEALRVLVATGAGFMLAVALVEMMPEAVTRRKHVGYPRKSETSVHSVSPIALSPRTSVTTSRFVSAASAARSSTA